MLRNWIILVMTAVLAAGLGGCASSPQPFEYHNDLDEKPGPGLFSGEKGGYIIYGEPPAQKKDPEKTPAD